MHNAIHLAQSSSDGGRLIITHCRLRPEDMLPFGVPISQAMKTQIIKQTQSVLQQEKSQVRDHVLAICKQQNIPIRETEANADATPTDTGGGDGGSISAQFMEQSGRQVEVIRRCGRLADIVVVAKPDVDRNLGANSMKSALFHTGRPVMMCAETPAATPLTDHIAVAWDGSIESARAVGLMLWLLKNAKKVSILTVDNGAVEIAPEGLLAYFADHAIHAEIVRLSVRDTRDSVGKILWQASDTCGAGLTILGAYGHSQYYERAMGGVTQYFISHAQKPVILVH